MKEKISPSASHPPTQRQNVKGPLLIFCNPNELLALFYSDSYFSELKNKFKRYRPLFLDLWDKSRTNLYRTSVESLGVS